MRKDRFVILPAMAALTVAVHAAGTPQEREACTPDAFRFCTAAFPFEEPVFECLKANLPRLSRDCQDVIAATNKKSPPGHRKVSQ